MSTLDADLDAPARPVTADGHEVTQAREAVVGSLPVQRLLPLRLRRSVGAWCFIDHYGPASVDGVAGMDVPPHPHIGLQTVTWLLAGNVLHADSLGSEQMIRPGQLNLMTAGRGIAHAEVSPADHDPLLHGVQLWVALPEHSRQADPAFEHHADLPTARIGGLAATVLIGSLAGQRSPATAFSPIVGAELAAARDYDGDLPIDPSFEHVIFVTGGLARAAGTTLAPGSLLYLPAGPDRVPLTAPAGTTLMLLGGVPLGERLLMWWNFVARTPREIEDAASAWSEGRFGTVAGYAGEPLAAPALDPRLLMRRTAGQSATKELRGPADLR